MKSVKIKNISSATKQTYDITVANNHNFFCNNHLIHNCGYNAEIKVIIMNVSQDTITITKGMKVAQAVLCPVVAGKWVDLDRRNEMGKKDRGANGFGSTGIFG